VSHANGPRTGRSHVLRSVSELALGTGDDDRSAAGRRGPPLGRLNRDGREGGVAGTLRPTPLVSSCSRTGVSPRAAQRPPSRSGGWTPRPLRGPAR
jgi:hypothetical protein